MVIRDSHEDNKDPFMIFSLVLDVLSRSDLCRGRSLTLGIKWPYNNTRKLHTVMILLVVMLMMLVVMVMMMWIGCMTIVITVSSDDEK